MCIAITNQGTKCKREPGRKYCSVHIDKPRVRRSERIRKRCHYDGSEDSPRAFGYCARYEHTKKIRRGGDGHRWIVVRNDDGLKVWRPYRRYLRDRY